MQPKIALEEHFAIEETLGDARPFMPEDQWSDLRARLLDFHDQRLGLMDRYGIEKMIVSLNAPAIQAIPDARRAVDIARKANDCLAQQIARRPGRFAGLAALPMQDPEAAITELRRSIRELGFKGALVNGFSQRDREDSALYYDLPQYEPFWAELERLDVPFYLHPREPLQSQRRIYEGHPWLLGPVWAFSAETSVHALRLMASGLFDRHPKIQIILGHLGEGLPYNIWRVDHRIKKHPHGIPAKKPLSEYLCSNLHLTTAGNFRNQTLIDAILEIGADRILFSADYPFEEIGEAAEWFEDASISPTDRIKIGHTNALMLFHLAETATAGAV
jgi:predicted TIM-barrel fold metal-dependent hydrolase